MIQFVRLGEELFLQKMPPPELAVLPKILQFLSVGEELTLQLMTASVVSAGWSNTTNLAFGEHDLRKVDGYVMEDGTLFVAIRNFGEYDVFIENISVRLVVKNPDGSESAYGFR